MRFNQFLLILLCVSSVSFGQNSNIRLEKSKPAPYKLQRLEDNFIYTPVKDGFIRISESFDGAIMSFYGSSQDVSVDFADSARSGFDNEMIIKSLESDKYVLGFTSCKNYKSSSGTLVAYLIDKQNGKIKNKEELVTGEFLETIGLDQPESTFNVEISPDKSKIVAYYRKYRAGVDSKKSADEVFVFTVYDGELKQLWTKEVTIPIGQKDAYFQELVINNNGNIHWKINVPNTGTGISFVDLGYGQILKSNERKIKATHTLKIINVLNDGSQITINTIDTGLGSVYKAEFRTIENKHFLYGFYSPEGIINADGLFVAEIAPSGELINIRKAPISNLDIQKNISTESNKELQKCIAQNTSYLFNFDLKNLFINNDNSLTGFIEKHIYTVQANGNTFSHLHEMQEIFLVKFEESKPSEILKLNKNQLYRGKKPANIGFSVFVTNDFYYVLSTDHLENIQMAESGDLKLFNANKHPSVLFAYKIDRSNLSMQKILVTSMPTYIGNNKMFYFFDEFIKVSDDALLFEVIDSNIKITTVKLTFDE